MPHSLTLPSAPREYLDNSICESTARCLRLALFNYHLNRASRGVSWSAEFGAKYHLFRETQEALFKQWVVVEEKDLAAEAKLIFESAFAVATKDWTDPPIEHKKAYLDIGRFRKTCKEAHDNWINEKNLGYYKIVGTETPFVLPLPNLLCHSCWTWWPPDQATTDADFPGEHFCPTCHEPLFVEYFAGKLDQIIEWNRRLWVRDFKTTGVKYGTGWDYRFNPHHQFTGYVWAAKQLSGRNVDGVIVDIVYNIKTKGPEFHPTLCNRSSGDIEFWMEWVQYTIAEYRRAEATGTWPMRTTACNDYGGCFFKQCCSLGTWFEIQEWLESKTIYSVWDPMSPEREEGMPE